MNTSELLIIGVVGSLLLCLAVVILWATTDRGIATVRVPYTLLIILCLCLLVGLVASEVFPSARLTLWWLP